MLGRVFDGVEVNHERTARHNTSPYELADRLTGRRVSDVRRHGKFIAVALDDGQTMVTHLGMSGRWSVDGEEEIPHTHFIAKLDDGTVVKFVDPRTFGFVAVYDEEDIASSGVSRLGPDAWENPPGGDDLAQRLEGRTAPIKALLLDQRPVSGLGNIYADEALHAARIHPVTPGGELTIEDLDRLMLAVKEVLDAAIISGGTTLDDLAYLLPDGRAGENLTRLRVYGRHEEPCFVCGTPIERLVIRARSTHFCPSCQEMR